MSEATPPTPPASDETIAASPRSAESDRMPEAGETFGRYQVQRVLGTGGMGVVIAAHDPKLDRVVALKLLKQGADRANERVIREAQALAQLQHPSVITVFEVGTVQGVHFIAMEYVRGKTLKRWLIDDERSPAEVVEAFVRAGRGLQAAHDAGLVHRDFKPSNVLVGDDGRIRVVDFGLATARSLGNTADSGLHTHNSAPPVAADLTGTGIVMGTPAYMALEQHLGGSVDARSDQFSFCASLYEGLYGVRPFEARSLDKIALAKQTMTLSEPAAGRRVDPGLRKLVIRGLAPTPTDRWPSMQPLLDALERAIRPSRTPYVVAAVGVGAALGLFGITRDAPDNGCPPGAERAAEVWSAQRRAQVRERFAELKADLGEDAARRVDARLEAHLQAWIEQHDDTCQSRAAGELTGADLDLRMQCVRARLSETSAVVDVLLEADAEVVTQSTQAAASLISPERCADLEALRAQTAPPPPPELAQQVESIRETLAVATAQKISGQWQRAFEASKAAEASALEVPYRPLQIEAAQLTGQLAARIGELEVAKDRLTAAAHGASAEGLDQLAALAAGSLVFVHGYLLADTEEGLQWGRHANAAAERARLGGRQRAQIESNIASVYLAQGDYATAARRYQAALDILEATPDATHPDAANLLNNLGGALINMGRYDEGEAALDRALAIWETQLGERHPVVASTLSSLGALYERRREYAKALVAADRSLSIRRDAFGSEHPTVATSLDNRASLLLYTGKLEAAEADARKALAFRRESLPDPHPHLASSLTNLGMILEKQGRHEEAIDASKRAVEMWDATLGPQHPHSAYPRTALGIALLEHGEPKQALVPLRVALKLRDDPKRDPHLRARTLVALGRALHATGAGEEACPLLDEAIRLYAAAELPEDAATARQTRAPLCPDP
jgi:tetratricopeptide (TPR) repeat protein/predicted Ser/Thr protein kinase